MDPMLCLCGRLGPESKPDFGPGWAPGALCAGLSGRSGPGARASQQPGWPAVGLLLGGCQNYGPFLGVHSKGDIDIDVYVDTDS